MILNRVAEDCFAFATAIAHSPGLTDRTSL